MKKRRKYAYGINSGGLPSTINVGGPRLWTPAQMTTNLWLDADDISTMTKSELGLVSQWRDKSGNGHHVSQTDELARPEFFKEVGDGLGRIYFSNTKHMNNTLAQVISGNPDVIVAIVCLFNGPVGASDIICRLGLGSGSTMAMAGGSSGLASLFGDGNERYGPTPYTEEILLLGRREAGTDYQSSEMWQDGTELTRVSGGGDTGMPNISAGLELGGLTGGRNNGQINEIIIFDDLAEQERVEGYLAWNRGTQGALRIDHQYKNSPPLI